MVIPVRASSGARAAAPTSWNPPQIAPASRSTRLRRHAGAAARGAPVHDVASLAAPGPAARSRCAAGAGAPPRRRAGVGIAAACAGEHSASLAAEAGCSLACGAVRRLCAVAVAVGRHTRRGAARRKRGRQPPQRVPPPAGRQVRHAKKWHCTAFLALQRVLARRRAALLTRGTRPRDAAPKPPRTWRRTRPGSAAQPWCACQTANVQPLRGPRGAAGALGTARPRCAPPLRA